MRYDLGDGCTLHDRNEWAETRVPQASESRELGAVTTYVQHSTCGTTLGDTDPAQWCRNLFDFHVRGLGYHDIAYHLIVDELGDVWEGRALGDVSAAQAGHNLEAIACVVFRPTGGAAPAPLSRPVQIGLAKAYLLAAYAVGRPLTQRTHHELGAPTRCPARDLTAWIHAGGLTTLPAKKEKPMVLPNDPLAGNDPEPVAPAPDPLAGVFKELVPAAGISGEVVARIRTLVPVVVGVVLTWLQHTFGWRVTLDPGETGLLVLALTGLYYELVRRLEAWKPELGWLLGYPSPPKYETAA